MSLPSISFLHLTVSEIQARQDYCSATHLPAQPPVCLPGCHGENDTRTAYKGYRLKAI